MLEKNNNVTVNQHFVPRFYLEHFSEVKGDGNKKKVLISFYQFKDGKGVNNIPTKSICYEKNFYGKDGEREKKLAEKEKAWADVIKKIIQMDSYNLSKDEEQKIKEFAIYQDCRTLGIFRNFEKVDKERAEELNSMIQNIDKYKEEIEDKKVNELNGCDENIKCIYDLNISIIRFSTKAKLIISDMPIIKLNPLSIEGVGFSVAGLAILFPISPNKCILIYDDKIYDKCDSYMLIDDEEDVIKLNKYQVINSDERILSSKLSELSELYNDPYLLEIRKKFRQNKQVSSLGNENVRIIKSKLKNLGYEYALSFLKLPNYMERIPVLCRKEIPFTRKYDEQQRNNLRIQVYLKAYYLCNDKKLKAGYIAMQRLMDHYWEIENEKRIITPGFMKKIEEINRVMKLH